MSEMNDCYNCVNTTAEEEERMRDADDDDDEVSSCALSADGHNMESIPEASSAARTAPLTPSSYTEATSLENTAREDDDDGDSDDMVVVEAPPDASTTSPSPIENLVERLDQTIVGARLPIHDQQDEDSAGQRQAGQDPAFSPRRQLLWETLHAVEKILEDDWDPSSMPLDYHYDESIFGVELMSSSAERNEDNDSHDERAPSPRRDEGDKENPR